MLILNTPRSSDIHEKAPETPWELGKLCNLETKSNEANIYMEFSHYSFLKLYSHILNVSKYKEMDPNPLRISTQHFMGNFLADNLNYWIANFNVWL